MRSLVVSNIWFAFDVHGFQLLKEKSSPDSDSGVAVGPTVSLVEAAPEKRAFPSHKPNLSDLLDAAQIGSKTKYDSETMEFVHETLCREAQGEHRSDLCGKLATYGGAYVPGNERPTWRVEEAVDSADVDVSAIDVADVRTAARRSLNLQQVIDVWQMGEGELTYRSFAKHVEKVCSGDSAPAECTPLQKFLTDYESRYGGVYPKGHSEWKDMWLQPSLVSELKGFFPREKDPSWNWYNISKKLVEADMNAPDYQDRLAKQAIKEVDWNGNGVLDQNEVNRFTGECWGADRPLYCYAASGLDKDLLWWQKHSMAMGESEATKLLTKEELTTLSVLALQRQARILRAREIQDYFPDHWF